MGGIPNAEVSKKTKTPESNVHGSGLVPLKSLNALPGRDAECYAKEYVGEESERGGTGL